MVLGILACAKGFPLTSGVSSSITIRIRRHAGRARSIVFRSRKSANDVVLYPEACFLSPLLPPFSMRKVDECGMEKFSTLHHGENAIAILGDKWWPQKAKQEGRKDKEIVFFYVVCAKPAY